MQREIPTYSTPISEIRATAVSGAAAKPGNRADQFQLVRIGLSKPEDFSFDTLPVRIQLVDVQQAFLEFGCLFTGYHPVHSSLDFLRQECLQRRWINGVTSNCSPGCSKMYWIMEREDFPNTSENTSSSCRFGNGEAVLGAVLLSGQHIGELHTVAHQVTELADVRRWDKAGLDHAAHIQVADPLGVLAVGFVALLRLSCIWGGPEVTRQVFSRILNTGIQHFSCGFHADARAGVFGKPVMPDPSVRW